MSCLYYYTKYQAPALSGASIVSTTEVRKTNMSVLLIAESKITKVGWPLVARSSYQISWNFVSSFETF